MGDIWSLAVELSGPGSGIQISRRPASRSPATTSSLGLPGSNIGEFLGWGSWIRERTNGVGGSIATRIESGAPPSDERVLEW